MTPGFVHLHVHSEYSLEDGIIPVKKLVQRCAEQGMPAVAITDHGNLFALVKFYNAARAQGIKPIIGAELWMQGEGADAGSSLILLCRNSEGFRALSHLLSRAFLEGLQDGKARIQRAWLEEEDRNGLIALSAAGQGEIGQCLLRDPRRAHELARLYQKLFPDSYYIEIQRNGEAEQDALNEASIALALELGLPLLATNNAHFLDADDFAAFDARQCIAAGYTLNDERRPRRFTPEHRLPSAEEMLERFADLPEACANTVEIAKRCNLALTLGQYTLPDFPTPDGSPIAVYFRKAAEQGLAERLQALAISESKTLPYRERLLREVDVILQMGFPGYFLIVADFIQWAKDHGVPVGPGRGSGAGSLVAYALRITDLDPIANALLFERFLNPERVSMPDFDVDFCMDQRDRVIQYVAEKYGRERVGQIITFGTMKARAVVRDVGRVLNLPYGFVDQLAKLVPGDLGMTLAKALEESEELRRRQQEEDDVRELLDIALRLEGLPRHASTHAGGVVISPEPLADRLPLFTDGSEGSGNVTQLDKDDVEKMGLVKFDFLGLRTLTIIDIALRGINVEREALGQEPLDIAKLPLDDAPTFAQLKSTDTVAVFQLESSGMRDLIRRLQPDNFEDIVALVALFRPGPLQSGMVDDFIARKHGKAKVVYPHPLLESILKDTYGVIVYQEQVMQCAQVLANYSLGGADLLRRAMGKKKPEEMAKQREIFLAGAAKNGIEMHQATSIFDLMEKFAEYGFNKSHSAAYALVSYQTAYLKAHYPRHFMAAVLTADMDHTDKVVAMISECRRMEMAILPPCIQRSELAFQPEGEEGLRFGLGAIKGLGRAAVQAILDARAADGPFRDFFDFLCRIDGQRVNRRSLEALIKAGALDALQVPRAQLLASLESFLEAAQQQQRQAASAQSSLFGDESPEERAAPALSPIREDGDNDLGGERETLGFYLSDHPLRVARAELQSLGVQEIAKIAIGEQVFVAGMVVARRSMRTKRGDRMLFLTLEDETGRAEAVVFAETWRQFTGQIQDDQPLLILADASEDSYSGGLRLTAQRLLSWEEARVALARLLVLQIGAAQPSAKDLQELLAAHPGDCLLRIQLGVANGQARAILDCPQGIAASTACRAALDTLLDPSQQEWQYAPPMNLLANVVSLKDERQRRQRSA
ncbi:DNA polymerase III subunit alpha [Acidithiobacillus sp. IBUN Pt1247-S3]|uniref:DNA polymerase III subunit alpha n=1 Tax=Acidithiobacillus sp. IBUN Pt1247-S3 TaxID=3166642 RepID=UPI0034E4008A